MNRERLELPITRPADPEQRMQSVQATRVAQQQGSPMIDTLAVEEPLEIRLAFQRDGQVEQKSISITMRTPGNDAELAAGFLLTEGIVGEPCDLQSIEHVGHATGVLGVSNVVCVTLAPGTTVDLQRLERHFYTSSSCGVCGKNSIAALEVNGIEPLAEGTPVVAAKLIHDCPDRLRQAQRVFDQTGGLHAAALFDLAGNLTAVREDVGRHNAVDKLVGAALLAGRLPLSESILMLSGRASFELIQKAVLAGVPIVAAVGAPSTLAVALAERYRLTLLGFVRDRRFNVYTGATRIRL